MKAYPNLNDKVPTLVNNVLAAIENKPLKTYSPGFMGKLTGPMLVAFGHDHPEGYGVGPDLPGCGGVCCFLCCCFGLPCSPPAGHGAAKQKSEFNNGFGPKPGKGMSS